ncbi:MAG: S8 family peptidase [Chloroflexi bacterium OHK40]
MRYQPLTILILLLLATFGPLATPASAASIYADQTIIPGELLVRLRPGQSLAGALGPHLAAMGVRAAEPLPATEGLFRLTLPRGTSPTIAAARLAAAPGVAYAEPNRRRVLLRTPNDEVFEQQWGLRAILAEPAWDITTGAPIVVAVLDTGVDASHPDLEGKVLPGYNVFSGGADAGDDNGHGTAVAGLIAARSDNGSGIAGICWECRILPVKVLSARGSGDDAGVAAGIRWAADNGARVINLSLGGEGESQLLREAVDYATSKGIVVVAASGNERESGNPVSYPAAYPNVMAVGATGNGDTITGFSNTGDYLDIAAPGVGLWTTLPGGQYGPPNGTSFSSPYVAGAAALVLSLRPDLGWYDVACVLQASADDKGIPGKDDEYGWGRLNLLRALQLAPSYAGCPLDAPPPAPVPQPQPAPVAAPGAAPAAFAPISPVSAPGVQYFPETGHSLRGTFLSYWQAQGGLPIFGFPISEEFVETGSDGRPYTVQYFERHRFELHPEHAPPYNVQLARIGDDTLRAGGRDWFAFPRTGQQPGCLFFEATGQSLCEPFLSAWRASGLEFDGRAGTSFAESLALFGQPLSPPQVEEVAPGVLVTVQWFERARFEDHGGGPVLLGLLGNELVQRRGWR